MRHFRLWAILALVVVVVGAGFWAFWNYELRWRPKTITRHQAEIASILEATGWVSPGLKGGKLYVIASHDSADSIRFKRQELPKLIAKGVDTRVVEVVERDENGVAKSTPAGRATVAQIWITRDWGLLQAWDKAPVAAWTAQGIPTADGDMARMSVVEAGRSTVDKLTPLLKDNGVTFAYPLLVWWNDRGEMRACACQAPQTYRFVRKELGV